MQHRIAQFGVLHSRIRLRIVGIQANLSVAGANRNLSGSCGGDVCEPFLPFVVKVALLEGLSTQSRIEPVYTFFSKSQKRAVGA